ncbi:hypothetical protein [Cryobacterium flavum]|nr:hypothetical protein [Cryobacterium flavum]
MVADSFVDAHDDSATEHATASIAAPMRRRLTREIRRAGRLFAFTIRRA